MDTKGAADFLYMHPETLKKLAVNGEVPAARIGSKWIFLKHHLAEWLASKYNCKWQAEQSAAREEKTEWHSAKQKEPASTTSISLHQTENEYENLLGLKKKRRPKSTTTG